MKHIGFRFTAGVSAVVERAILPVLSALCLTLPVHAATRPHYGGTLRLEMRARVASLDPREWPADSTGAAAAERLASMGLLLPRTGRPRRYTRCSAMNGSSAFPANGW